MTSGSDWRDWMWDLISPPAAKAQRAAIVWSAIALVSLTAAAWVAMSPRRPLDFKELMHWLEFWNFGALDPYGVPVLGMDYPPNGLLVLAPLRLLPRATAHLWYTGVNVGATVLAGWLFVRWVATRSGVALNRVQTWALTAMFLSTGMVRSSIWIGQTMSLALLLGVAALWSSRRHPIVAAVCLALLAFKPHVALGFGLGIALVDGLAAPLGGALGALLLFIAYSMISGEPSAFVAAEYFGSLSQQYGLTHHVLGVTSAWELLDLFGSRTVTLVVGAALATASILWLVAAGLRARRDSATGVLVIAASLAWTLLVLPYQKFGLMLAMPAWWLAMWPATGLIRDARARGATLVFLTAFAVVDPAFLAVQAVRRQAVLSTLLTPYKKPLVAFSLYPFRLLVIAAFVLLVREIGRRRGGAAIP